jgi:2-polyprenyl-3-methyl-5-hydroxy-6-metoxy-1,4-benzoquinol methylase
VSQRVDQLLLEQIGSALAPGAKILDLPAGDGDLTRKLCAAGYTARASDRFPEFFKWTGQKPVCSDMNLTLPFADGAFDGVVCQEGIEHLENPSAFLRECARVIRDGGFVWLTTPNYMDLSSRFAYLLTGMKSFHAGFPNEETTVWARDGASIYHGHAFTLPFFQLRYLLRVTGFQDVVLRGATRSPTSTWLYPLIRPFSGWLYRNRR